MARQHFDQEMRSLQHDIMRMGSMVEKMVDRAIKALQERDVALAEQVISDDSELDQLAYATEDQALLLIATQQPVASDLRRLASAVVITHELERMGDHAEGVAKLSRKLSAMPVLKPIIDIPRMGEQVTDMLHQALDAYLHDDVQTAARVWEMDDRVDALYNQVYRELLTYMMNDPNTIERATHLLHIAHDVERVGDRVTNICERVMYIVTGDIQYVRSIEPGVLPTS